MISTGCDIVALKAVDAARTRQLNFYSKIITPAEKGLYDSSCADLMPLELFVWLAWSVKESVYKFLQRTTPDLVFSPSKIVLEQITISSPAPAEWPAGLVYQGTVSFSNRLLHFRSITTTDFIFSMVNASGDFNDTYWEVKPIDSTEPSYQSAAVRDFIIEKLDNLFSGGNLAIQKAPHGFPTVLQNDVGLPVAVAFTHHDHWVAYCFVLSQ